MVREKVNKEQDLKGLEFLGGMQKWSLMLTKVIDTIFDP